MRAAILLLLLAAGGLAAFLFATKPVEVDFDQIDTSEITEARAACLAAQMPSAPEGATLVSIPGFPQAWFAGVGGEGYSQLRDDRLEVHFATITLKLPNKVNPYTSIAEHFVEGVQVGLATGEPRELPNQGGGMVFERWGEMLHINQTMSPGETVRFENYATSFSVADIENMDEYYFVLKADITFSFDFYRPTYSPEIPDYHASHARSKCRGI